MLADRRKEGYLEYVNRATLSGYMHYMLNRPFYFLEVSGMKATVDNIEKFYRELERDGLICAIVLPQELVPKGA